MKRKYLLISFILSVLALLTEKAIAQSNKDILTADSLFSGVWKGSSLCQVKNSPCHDENVVFHIPTVNKDDVMEIIANKMVDGKEEGMGKIQFRYDVATKEIVSISQPNGNWKFKRVQNTLEGTLYYNNALYRIIKLAKN